MPSSTRISAATAVIGLGHAGERKMCRSASVSRQMPVLPIARHPRRNAAHVPAGHGLHCRPARMISCMVEAAFRQSAASGGKPSSCAGIQNALVCNWTRRECARPPAAPSATLTQPSWLIRTGTTESNTEGGKFIVFLRHLLIRLAPASRAQPSGTAPSAAQIGPSLFVSRPNVPPAARRTAPASPRNRRG